MSSGRKETPKVGLKGEQASPCTPPCPALLLPVDEIRGLCRSGREVGETVSEGILG